MSAKVFEEAHERHSGAHDGPRWVPVATATLAVLAAGSSFVSGLRTTAALFAKNDAAVAITRASDSYTQYQAERIKFSIAQTALDAGIAEKGDAAKVRATAEREAAKAPPLLDKAHTFEHASEVYDQRSERLLAQHETMEVAVTLFEVSIVMISVTALVGSRLLPLVAGVAAVSGVVIFVYGLIR